MRSRARITHGTEFLLGLIDHHGNQGKSIEQVGTELRDKLDTAEQNIRMFLAIKAVLDTAVNIVGMDVPADAGVLAGAKARLDAFINLYNLWLEDLKEERRSRRLGETRLEKALSGYSRLSKWTNSSRARTH